MLVVSTIWQTKDKLVAPALQVLLGGGNLGNGQARFADKVVKVPSKRGPEALRVILNDFTANGKGADFVDYYVEKGEHYFYDLLTHLSDVDALKAEDFIDWGSTLKYEKAIGIGECAGVIIDLIATLFFESEEKIQNAQETLEEGKWAASIYHSYSSIINSAKALLLAAKKKTNTHAGIIADFDTLFVASEELDLGGVSFEAFALQINKAEPTEAFAKSHIEDAKSFLEKVEAYRKQDLLEA